ncbi:MAG: leucine-rich repeat domain-containing protein [Bordetella sp.]|nr:leucine-rich repeat domain-containing protein [Bordetella sp.]
MSAIAYTDPMPAHDERWVCLHSSHAAQFPGSTPTVFHDAPPDAATLARIRSLHLWAPPLARIAEVPALIAQMPALVALSIGPGSVDPALIGALRADLFPPSLRHLALVPGQGSHTWKGGAMPHLLSLFIDRPLRFDPADFPSLQSLAIVPDARGTTLDRALQLPLRELDLLNVPFDEAVFARIAALPLEALGLVGGRTLASLDGIQALAGLRALRIKNQNALQRIAAIANLDQLRQLDIQYCPKITDITTLDRLRTLQSLTLVGCRNIGLGPLEHQLAARIPQTHIAATT